MPIIFEIHRGIVNKLTCIERKLVSDSIPCVYVNAVGGLIPARFPNSIHRIEIDCARLVQLIRQLNPQFDCVRLTPRTQSIGLSLIAFLIDFDPADRTFDWLHIHRAMKRDDIPSANLVRI